MNDFDGESSTAQEAVCTGVHCKVTPLAITSLWCSVGVALLLFLSTGGDSLPTLLGFLSLLILLFVGSWFYGRAALTALIPDAIQPATGFAWEQLPIRFGLHHVGQSFAARDVLLFHGAEANRRGLFSYHASIAPGESLWVHGTLRLPRRGRFHQHGLRITSSFPFGLLRWTSAWELPADLLALPRLGALRDAGSLVPTEHETLAAGAKRIDDADEFHTLKRWRPGMSQRSVHWKSSAKRGQTMLREMQGVRYPRLRLELIAPAPSTSSKQKRTQKLLFEQSICLTASLIDFFLRHNYQVEVACLGFSSPIHLETQRGRRGLFRALSCLAEIEMPGQTTPALVQPLHSLHMKQRQGSFRIQVGVGVGNLRQAGLQRLDVSDPATKRWFHADRRFSNSLLFRSQSA